MTVRRDDVTVLVQPESEPAELAALLAALRRHRSRKSLVVGPAPALGRWRRLGRVASAWRPAAGWREVARSEGVGYAGGVL
ncbi:hypothetical protein HRbin26_00301 [bacterium HR26]|nr:hypothetical protein HRbin26_00301 [bacterium HR26]